MLEENRKCKAAPGETRVGVLVDERSDVDRIAF